MTVFLQHRDSAVDRAARKRTHRNSTGMALCNLSVSRCYSRVSGAYFLIHAQVDPDEAVVAHARQQVRAIGG